MRFDARELKSYAEPVSPSDLKEGEIYFFLTFVDEKLLIPELTPVVFIGKDIEHGDRGMIYFQDAASYGAGVRRHAPGGELEAEYHCAAENQINHVFEYEKALDQLLLCSIKRSRSSAIS